MRTPVLTFMLLCASTMAVHAQEPRPAPSPNQAAAASPKQTPSPAPLPAPPKMGAKEVRGGGADTNKDGYISPAEMKAHRQKMIKDHPSAKQAKAPSTTSQGVFALDTNKDGFISKEEREAAAKPKTPPKP